MKTGGGDMPLSGFESHGFRLRGHGPTGRRQHGMLEIRVSTPGDSTKSARSRGPTATTLGKAAKLKSW